MSENLLVSRKVEIYKQLFQSEIKYNLFTPIRNVLLNFEIPEVFHPSTLREATEAS